MALWIEQQFPLGRFHATIWRPDPRSQAYDEWPPSPWRLLRAIAARWFQWSRETGHEDQQPLDNLLRRLASESPSFLLPIHSGKTSEVRQYQPTEWKIKNEYLKLPPNVPKGIPKKLDCRYPLESKSLSVDRFIDTSDQPIFWKWSNLTLMEREAELVERLLARITYFGRAESYCRLRRLSSPPASSDLNEIVLLPRRCAGAHPVLVADGAEPELVDRLLRNTDHEDVKDRTTPPGSVWCYAILPASPRIRVKPRVERRFPGNLQCIQFDIAGIVLPRPTHYAELTTEFRKRVIKNLLHRLTGKSKTDFRTLAPKIQCEMQGIVGKDALGRPLLDHSQASFWIVPDEETSRMRFVVWRPSPFTHAEIASILEAAQSPLLYDRSAPKWSVRLIPLPWGTPLTNRLAESSTRWTSITPFAMPLVRHAKRKNGKARRTETPENIVLKLCEKTLGLGSAEVKSIFVEPWQRVKPHLPARIRGASRTLAGEIWGYRVELGLSRQISGPIALGESAHFGLGLFSPASGVSDVEVEATQK